MFAVESKPHEAEGPACREEARDMKHACKRKPERMGLRKYQRAVTSMRRFTRQSLRDKEKRTKAYFTINAAWYRVRAGQESGELREVFIAATHAWLEAAAGLPSCLDKLDIAEQRLAADRRMHETIAAEIKSLEKDTASYACAWGHE